MSEDQKLKLEKQLWNIANELRGKMDADEFRDYILGFIFYKYLSEKQHLFANQLLETEEVKEYLKLTNTEDLGAIRDESLEKLGYFLLPNELFSSIAKKGNGNKEEEDVFILEDLEAILNNVENSTMGTESEDDFNKLFEDLDLSSTKLGRSPDARNELIAKVLSHLDKIDFELADTDSDVLGDAYEYLIGQFASGAGKKAGEFYTPQEVSKILAKLVTTGKKRLKNVYDPTCGSGSLLLRVSKEVEVAEFFGQELNRTTYNLARMNMILHDVHYSRFDIRQEDTLVEPQHFDKRFEAIVANPPFSAKWKSTDNPLNESDERFSQYGKLAPKSTADFAFVQHMIHQLADNGTMACVLPHGVLFRSGAESVIREYIIEKQNYLDAVIGLPANIFFGTSIPTCIMVLSKCRVNSDDILFIDASKEFEKEGNKNKLRDENIEKIITTYRKREAIEKFSHMATLDEIRENDYNLNIPRYVDTFEEEEPVDLQKTATELNATVDLLQQLDAAIQKFCEQLDIPKPIGVNYPLLEQYKKGAMQQIFTQQIRFKDDNGNAYPDWEEKKIGKVLTIGSGKDYKHLNEGEIPVYGTGGLMTKVDEYLYDGESVCIGRKGTIDKPAFLTGKFWTVDTLFYTHSFIGCLPKFLFYVFNTINWKRYNEASGVPSLSKTTIEKIKIGLPSIEEQTKIANFMSAIDAKIELMNTQLENTQQFKKGLLQKMFV